jgi:hypothetical protein
MSAWVCSPKHIAVLAQRLIKKFGEEPSVYVDEIPSPAEFAENLAKLNLKSVAYRYNMTPAKAAREFQLMSMKEYIRQSKLLAETLVLDDGEFGPADMWGLSASYLYQSCEHPGAEKDITYRTVKYYEQVVKSESRRLALEMGLWSI